MTNPKICREAIYKNKHLLHNTKRTTSAIGVTVTKFSHQTWQWVFRSPGFVFPLLVPAAHFLFNLQLALSFLLLNLGQLPLLLCVLCLLAFPLLSSYSFLFIALCRRQTYSHVQLPTTASSLVHMQRSAANQNNAHWSIDWVKSFTSHSTQYRSFRRPQPSSWLVLKKTKSKLECGPMPNIMAAVPNIGGALCSMLSEWVSRV